MKFAYVLEDDAKFMKDIAEALLQIEPKLQIRQFATLEAFVAWMKVLMQEGTAAVAKGGQIPAGVKLEPANESEPPVLQLVISKVEFLGARQLGLMKKTRELFVRTGVCTSEDPTAFVLTAFEDPNFHVRDLKDRILANILMKPFDRLILQQHLTFALEGRHPPSKHAVAPYKTTAIIEVLKIVQMETLSPIGFTTKSNRELPAGAVAKYYGRMFISERHRSLIAKMHRCEPVPGQENEFIASFLFFGADSTQISNLRRKVLESKAKTKIDSISSNSPAAPVRIVFVEDRKEVVQSLEPTLKRKIRGAEFLHFANLRELLFEIDPKLDTEAAGVKAFAPAAPATVEMDHFGRITKAEGAPVQFYGKPLQAGTLLTPWIRESERNGFLSWLKKPQGTGYLIWTDAGRTALVKMSFLHDRKFTIEEATADEKERYAKKNSRLAAGWDFMFISHRFAGVDRLPLWGEILSKGKALGGQGRFGTFVVAAQEYTDDEERQMAATFDDLFFLPLERVYVLQKMMQLKPNLEILEDPIEIYSMPCREEIRSARKAEIEELSEAGLVMKYDRAMSLGSFREFVLWQPYEIDAPEINATCNFVDQAGGSTKLHFVFFAMKDILLKAIRHWIMTNYVNSKSQGN